MMTRLRRRCYLPRMAAWGSWHLASAGCLQAPGTSMRTKKNIGTQEQDSHLAARAHLSLHCSPWPPEPVLHTSIRHVKTGHASWSAGPGAGSRPRNTVPLTCSCRSWPPASQRGRGTNQTLMAPVERLPRAHVVGRPSRAQQYSTSAPTITVTGPEISPPKKMRKGICSRGKKSM
jgi:hypothetical protein